MTWAVMAFSYDWNDGRLPILSVMIQLWPPGRLLRGNSRMVDGVSGTDYDLSFVEKTLTRMMEECGLPVRYTSHSPALWMSGASAAERVVQSYSSHPSDADTLSVFTADRCAEGRSRTRRAIRSPKSGDRSRLYGWYLTGEPTYREHGLRAEPNPDGLFFGVCRHMDVRGWPTQLDKRLIIAQAPRSGVLL